MNRLFASTLMSLAALSIVAPTLSPSFAQDATPEAGVTDPLPTRLRAAHYVVDAPAVDIYLDGELAFENVGYLTTTPYSEIEPGEYELSIVVSEPAPLVEETPEAGDTTAEPTRALAPGLEPGDVLVEGETVTIAEGDDHLLGLIGQLRDGSAQPLLIDETATIAPVQQAAGEASYAVLIHGISDAPAVDFSLDGETLHTGLEFGDYAPIPVSVAPHDIAVTFTDDPDFVLFQNSGETPPAGDFLLVTVMVGSYPDRLDVTGAISLLPEWHLPAE